MLKDAIQKMKDERNAKYHEWYNFENSFKRLDSLGQHLSTQKIEVDGEFCVEDCSFTLFMDHGPNFYIQGAPNTYETYWGWALSCGYEKVCVAKNEEDAAGFAKVFLAAKKLYGS